MVSGHPHRRSFAGAASRSCEECLLRRLKDITRMRIRFTVLDSRMVKRLFVAINPPADVARRLAELDPGIDGLRWATADRLHVTLCFLGNVAEDAHGRLVEALAAIACEPFPLRVKRCGCFAKHGGLVLWAGLDDPSDALPLLHRKVARAVRAAGLDP
ncbi:MAG: RNA 2',3'-cyclic phosphodiesterase, partial [Verrucomicrobiaceae bacterium]